MEGRLVNVVIKTQLLSKKNINLRILARDFVNVIYNPGRFSGMVWKHKVIGGCCLLFSNGKMIVNGFDSISGGRQGARRYARLVQKKIKGGQLQHLNVVTVTMVPDIEKKLCLEGMAFALDAWKIPAGLLGTVDTFGADAMKMPDGPGWGSEARIALAL